MVVEVKRDSHLVAEYYDSSKRNVWQQGGQKEYERFICRNDCLARVAERCINSMPDGCKMYWFYDIDSERVWLYENASVPASSC